MPKNNFKLFDENKSNMMTDADYNTNNQRLNGVQSGVASSQLQNKTLYQTALMCYALAQLMAANGYDANDADAVSTFVNNMSRTMVQKVVDKATADDVARKVAGKWVDAKQLGELKTDVEDNYLPLLGGTMLGDLILNRDPISSLQAATKNYVDGFCKIATGRYSGNGQSELNIDIGFKPKFLYVYTVLEKESVYAPTNSLTIFKYFLSEGAKNDSKPLSEPPSMFWIDQDSEMLIGVDRTSYTNSFIYRNWVVNDNGIKVSLVGSNVKHLICNAEGESYIWVAFGGSQLLDNK